MVLLLLVIMIPTLIIFAIALGIHLGFAQDKTNDVQAWYKDTAWCLVGATLGTVVGIIIYISIAINSTNSARDLETFYYDNSPILLEATQEIKEGVRESHGYFYDAARINHITVYAGQVQEYQHNAIVYNKDLRRHVYWQNHLLFKFVYGRVAGEVQALPTLGLR